MPTRHRRNGRAAGAETGICTRKTKSLAEFAARRRQKSQILFSHDMCVRENTSQAASVEFVRLRRTNYARSRLQPPCRKKPQVFSTVLKTVPRQSRGTVFVLMYISRCQEALSVFSGSRLVMLFRLMPRVDILCSSADVVGGRMPTTPSTIREKLKPTMKR